jgi:chaperonin GroES
MNLKPLGDRVIVKQDEAEEKTASGLILSSGSQDKPQHGTVISVGPGKPDKEGNLVASELKEGDKVIYSKYGGNEIKIDEVTYLILRADDIMAVIQ